MKGEDGTGLAGWASISFYSLDDPLTPVLSFWGEDEFNWTARGVPPGNYRVFFDVTDYNHYQGGDYISEWHNDAAAFSLATTITVDSTTSIVTGINGVLEKLGKVASTGVKADVNGDGKADTVVLYDKGHWTSSLWVFLSSGSKFTPKIFYSSSPGSRDATRTKIAAGDVHKDGKSDAIILYDCESKTSALYALISSGIFLLRSVSGFLQPVVSTLGEQLYQPATLMVMAGQMLLLFSIMAATHQAYVASFPLVLPSILLFFGRVQPLSLTTIV